MIEPETAAPKPLGLALDTSGDVCSLALGRGETLIAEYRFTHQMHLSERMLTDLSYLLKQSDLTLNEIAYFAVGIGPGSFTGTRVAVTTVKMWADTLQKPVYGVNSLEAIASDWRGIAPVIVPLLPCRKREVYLAAYGSNLPDEPLTELIAPRVISLDAIDSSESLFALLQSTKNSDILFIGESDSLLTPEDRVTLEDAHFRFRVSRRTVSVASQALSLAFARFQSSEPGISGDDPVRLTPLYLAPPPISQPKQPFG